MSEQERQSSEAVSRLESTKHPLDDMESEDTWSLVVLELLATASSSGSASPLVGLVEGLGHSHCCFPESVLVSGVGLGIWSSPHVELCSLPTSTAGEVMRVLLT